MVLEKNRDVKILDKLGFAHCRLSLAIPKEDSYTGPAYFMNKKVATSYPRVLSEYMSKNNIKAEIEEKEKISTGHFPSWIWRTWKR